MSWSKTGITHYLAQLGLPDKGREIKGLVVCNSCDISAFGPAKRFGSTLLLSPKV